MVEKRHLGARAILDPRGRAIQGYIAGAMDFDDEPPDDLFAPWECDDECAWSQPPEEPSENVVLPVSSVSPSTTSLAETPKTEVAPVVCEEEPPEKVAESRRTRISCKRPRRESDGVDAGPIACQPNADLGKGGWDAVVANMENLAYEYNAAESMQTSLLWGDCFLLSEPSTIQLLPGS